jgi:hypothetical protein
MFSVIHTLNKKYISIQHSTTGLIMDSDGVLCEVGTKLLYVIYADFRLQVSGLC